MRPVALSLVALRRVPGERFPPWATVPLGALLYAAPASLAEPAPARAGKGRAGDVSRPSLSPHRRRPHGPGTRSSAPPAARALLRSNRPRRGSATPTWGWRWRSSPSSRRRVWRLAFFVGACAHYRAWFSYGRERVHPVARPFLSNLVFPCAVFHGAGPGAWRPAILLALYAWLAAVAHEFATTSDLRRRTDLSAPVMPGRWEREGPRPSARPFSPRPRSSARCSGWRWAAHPRSAVRCSELPRA